MNAELVRSPQGGWQCSNCGSNADLLDFPDDTVQCMRCNTRHHAPDAYYDFEDE